MTPSLLTQIEQRGIRLEAKLRFTSDRPLDAETLTLLKTHKATLMAELTTGPYGLEHAARDLLQGYRDRYGPMQADAWLEHAQVAHAKAVDSFPEHRRPYALQDYLEQYCLGMSAPVIAAHTVALELWAQVSFGSCLEAACKACGVDVDTLPQNG